MSIGKKAKTANSPYQNLNHYMLDLGQYGSALTNTDAPGYRTSFMASQPLSSIQTQSMTGLAGNLGYLAQTPESQLNELKQGRNPYYEASKRMLDDNLAQQTAQAQLKFSRQGLQNSTTSGAYQGYLANQATLRDLMNQVSSLDFLNDRARANAATQLNAFNSVNDLIFKATDMTNRNAQLAMQDRGETARFNAQEANKQKSTNFLSALPRNTFGFLS